MPSAIHRPAAIASSTENRTWSARRLKIRPRFAEHYDHACRRGGLLGTDAVHVTVGMSDGEAEILRAERGRVLVVDDDVDVCALLEARLGGRGFEVAWTTSAQAALDSLATAEVDAVLTDIKMGRMSGLELCERLVASRPDLPVVVMTAFGTIETAIAAIRAGAYDFVTKPVEIDALVVALERAVEHRALR